MKKIRSSVILFLLVECGLSLAALASDTSLFVAVDLGVPVPSEIVVNGKTMPIEDFEKENNIQFTNRLVMQERQRDAFSDKRRNTVSDVEREKMRNEIARVSSHLQLVTLGAANLSLFTDEDISAGTVVGLYPGEVVNSLVEGEYSVYSEHDGKKFSVDASKFRSFLAYANHAPTNLDAYDVTILPEEIMIANLKTELQWIDGYPVLVTRASKDIKAHSHLVQDYGDEYWHGNPVKLFRHSGEQLKDREYKRDRLILAVDGKMIDEITISALPNALPGSYIVLKNYLNQGVDMQYPRAILDAQLRRIDPHEVKIALEEKHLTPYVLDVPKTPTVRKVKPRQQVKEILQTLNSANKASRLPAAWKYDEKSKIATLTLNKTQDTKALESFFTLFSDGKHPGLRIDRKIVGNSRVITITKFTYDVVVSLNTVQEVRQ